MNKTYPVSIVICALNEELRIKDTIESAKNNHPAEIIVVEGGSTDKTFEIASKYADHVISTKKFGLGYKRAIGVEKANQKYILNLDADQVLDNNALSTMINELEQNNYVGIQASLKGVINETYWEKAMSYNVGLTNPEPKETRMIGTPALYKLEVLKRNNFNKLISGSCDDTDLCYRLVLNGFKLGVSTAICFQKHRSTFKTTYKKFLWYGEGDCEFAINHPERFWSIYTHPIRTYFFKKSILAVKKGDIKFVPFFMLTGLVRHIGFYKYSIKRALGIKSDSRVNNRNDLDF
jgi:glycosyltransferase involved in cell wall biosynthesis